MSGAPAALPLNPTGIPADLKALDRWVVWAWELRGRNWTKPPHNPTTGTLASSTDPATWTDYDTAIATQQQGGWPGVGVVLTADDDHVVIDLDHCRDPASGVVAPWALTIVRAVDSYTEVSPTGTGVHILARARLPHGWRKRGDVEVYESARYMTVTGHRVDGTPTTVEHRQVELDAFHAEHAPPPTPNFTTSTTTTSNSDGEVLRLAFTASNGAKVAALHRGDLAGHPSNSEADMALCAALAFYTQDRAQLDRLFRGSGRMRPKWERADYRENTITRALTGLTETYTAPSSAQLVDAPDDTQRHRTHQHASENGAADSGSRKLHLTAASSIPVRPVKWLWDGRLPLGTLGLLAGREGLGKSTFAYARAADITRGRLPGDYHGQPRAVIIAATEDSWAHTIVPRLMAADADLDLVYRVDVVTSEGTGGSLSMPRDLTDLQRAVRSVGAALVLLDPLLSRFDTALDTHVDAEVRVGLEPLVAIADQAGAAVWGLIHLNKSTSSDPLTLVMGSRALVAVARSVLVFARDPEDDTAILVGQEKNNLGRLDLPTLKLRIESAHVADTEEGAVWTSRTVWAGETSTSIKDAIEDAAEGSDARTATSDAVDWLTDYLVSVGGTDEAVTIKKEGKKAGHADRTLARARGRAKIVTQSHGFPRKTWWTLPEATVSRNAATEDSRATQSCQPAGETGTNGMTGTTVARQRKHESSRASPASQATLQSGGTAVEGATASEAMVERMRRQGRLEERDAE